MHQVEITNKRLISVHLAYSRLALKLIKQFSSAENAASSVVMQYIYSTVCRAMSAWTARSNKGQEEIAINEMTANIQQRCTVYYEDS